MYNPNPILKTFYYTSLKNVVGVPVFKGYVPNGLETDAYVLISNVQNNDASTINTNNYKAFVTIGIYTRTPVENNGITCDSIADAIFSI